VTGFNRSARASWYAEEGLRKAAIQQRADALRNAQECGTFLAKLDASQRRETVSLQPLKRRLQATASPAATLDEGIGRRLEKRQAADPVAVAMASSPMYKAVAEGVAALAKRISGLESLDRLAPFTAWKQ
jgi:hypothetical protein